MVRNEKMLKTAEQIVVNNNKLRDRERLFD